MKRFVYFAVALVACARSADPAKGTPDGRASVHGNVYLVMASGDTKRGAGRTVFLSRDTDSLQATIGRVCDEYAGRARGRWDTVAAAQRRWLTVPMDNPAVDALQQRQAAILARNRADELASHLAIDLAIMGAVADTTGSGLDARYAFRGVQPGRYLLFAAWDIGEHQYRFVAPITLAPRDDVTRDLDNSAERSSALYCSTSITADSMINRMKAMR